MAANSQVPAQEIEQIPNISPYATFQQVQALHQAEMAAIQELADRLTKFEDLFYMRLHNATLGLTGPLHYPPGIDLPNVAPTTKLQLLELDIQACQTTALALGLEPVATASVVDRQLQIANYLGVVYS